MVEVGGGNLLERLGPDPFSAVLMRLEDPADLARLAAVSHSWRRFVIANGFCKKLCLRMNQNISYFVRAIEVGSSSKMEVVPTSVQWQMLESEHRIYAYLGYCISSPKFLQVLFLEAIAISRIDDSMKNMVPNDIDPNMSSTYITRQGNSRMYKLSAKFCVVREIRIQPGLAMFRDGTVVNGPISFLFRLGHMRENKANRAGTFVENSIWTYVSPIFSMSQTDNVQSFKLPRPEICINGIVQIEVFIEAQRCPNKILSYINGSSIKALGYPLAPAFDVSILDRMENSVLMYFPGIVGNCCRPSSSRNKLINAKRKRICRSS